MLIFVCLATQAIHLEATNGTFTEFFLAAFTRFFPGGGCSCYISSDNGTAFVQAAHIFIKDKARLLEDIKPYVDCREKCEKIEPDLSNEYLNHNLFAYRWKDEYLVNLHKRNKW